MEIHPYVIFDGHAEEAITFYRQAIGAEVLMQMRYRDAPAGNDYPSGADMADKIMHARLKIGTTELMLSDGMAGDDAGATPSKRFHLSLTVADRAAGERCFQALAQGGQVTMPFQPTFWSEGFGMAIDPFGVCWMVNVDHPAA